MHDTKLECHNMNLLRAFMRSELNESTMFELESHLASCSYCRNQLETNNELEAVWIEARRFLGQHEAQIRTFDDETDGDGIGTAIHAVLSLLGPTDDPDMLGRIGPYEVTGVVGSGGMGVVLKAVDKSLDRVVAIKVLAPHLACSGNARKRFAREAKAAAAVLHPNVIAVHSVNAESNPPYLVMPFIRGSSLQKRLDERGAFSLVEVLRIGAQIAAGLSASHEQGLVHRDIKPANILLEDGVERVTITDFGLARAMDDVSLTRSGIISGTPLFMSPEQSIGEPVTQRSDLFSLGSLLYTICTGIPPFRAETPYAVLKQIADTEPISIRERNPEMPDWFERMIVWLMKKDVAQRPIDARSVEQLLRRCLAHVEQPQHCLLPSELKLHIPRSRTHPIRRIMMIASIAALLVFTTWSFLSPAGTQESGKSSVEQKQQIAGGSTVVEGYEIMLQGTGSVQGLAMSTQFDLARMKTQFEKYSESGQSSEKDRNDFDAKGGRGGMVAGVARGGGGGAGGGFGQSYKKPNFGIAFSVKPKDKDPKGFAEIGSAIRVVESDGSVTEFPALGPTVNRFLDFEKRFPGSQSTYLYREASGTPKTIEGELRITTGRKLEARFDGTKKQSKSFGKDTITLDSVNIAKDEIQIVVTYPELTTVRNAKTPQERFQATVGNRSAYAISIEDSNGQLMAPSSGTGNNTEFQSTFSLNQGNGFQTMQGKAGMPKNQSKTFTFPALADGATIKTIIATYTDRMGETKVVPFSIQVQSANRNKN